SEARVVLVAFTVFDGREPPLSAIPGVMHRSKKHRYSITSSARASSVGGTSSPSAFAVLGLSMVSYLVGIWTGRSAGFSASQIDDRSRRDFRRVWSLS